MNPLTDGFLDMQTDGQVGRNIHSKLLTPV